MRLFLVASLMTTFTSFASGLPEASAESERPRFAQPPAATRVATAEKPDTDRWFVGVISRADVRAKLASNRAANLQRFRAYQSKGSFPSNTYTPGALNVWLDQDGKFCAAATIIRSSGQFALVDQIAQQNNFIKLGDVKSGGLMDWILTSGLTQAEIAAIQEPFIGVTDEPGEPSWQEPRVVDGRMRAREDARLRAKYKQVEQQIAKNTAASLDAATDRLMNSPSLAGDLLAGRI
jgi:hypothetical protein